MREGIVLLIHASNFSYPQPKVDTLPWGILHLASALKNQKIQSRIVDLNVDKLSSKHLEGVRCVGISTTSYAIDSALRAAQLVRKYNTLIPIIWGGIHPTLDPETTIRHPLVDAVFRGEGENHFPQICKLILEGENYKAPSCLFTKEHASSPETVFELNKLPAIHYELLDVSHYNENILEIHSARGCPYNCNFCYNAGRIYRSKSPERILEDIHRALKVFSSPKVLVFNDDQFFVNLSKVRKVCELLLKNQINLPWVANCRVEDILKIDAECFKLLRESRCSLLKVGIESGSEKIQRLIGKGSITPETVKEIVVRCRENQIDLKLNFMIGLPEEEISDLKKTANLISQCFNLNPSISRIAVGVYDPYPNTPLWSLALRLGYKAPRSLEEWRYWKGELNRLQWLTKKYRRIIRNFLFLTIPFDKPYTHSLSGLWSRQPTNSLKMIWKIWEYVIRWDFLCRVKSGWLNLVPERYLYECFYSKVGIIYPKPKEKKIITKKE